MSIADIKLQPASASRQDSLRVMIVDDAIVVRGLLGRWIEAEPGLQVVASLRSGREAIEQVDHLNPDVVILDVDMPDIDGITALPHLLEKRRDLVVIMSSTLTRRNAEVSLRALSLGAADYIPKPESTREIVSSESFRRELIEKIRALGARRKQATEAAWPLPWAPGATAARLGERTGGAALRGVSSPAPVPAAEGAPFKLRPMPSVPPHALLIGASTGGPQALGALVGRIGPVIDTAPVLITQHMPPTFTTILAEILGRAAGRPVHEATDGEALRAGAIYVAPGGHHLRVVRRAGVPTVALDDGPQINFCRPAVDPMFSSAAETWGSSNLALVLTGMGSDGMRGASDIVAAGGTVIAQDEQTSVIWGMPGSVVKAGLCSAVLPLDSIADTVAKLFCGDRP
ncbi:MAG TPA: chemotaxis response regulator protein-glutamate methylesterase [Xanthobacteraceae bacterium]|nr:chemotaxis response regulator protein-glutamate methylesterase [Xanthobacteraceae bacterium]